MRPPGATDLTPLLVRQMSRQQLALIATDRETESPRARAAALTELERRYPCRDCGAPAGEQCRPEYGCLTAEDRVPA